MHYVLIIVMERYLTLTLTSDHINNTRNEFLRSDLYENMVLRMNLALLSQKVMICLLLGWPCWILANYKSSPKCPAGNPVEVHAGSTVYGAFQMMSYASP